MRTAQAVSRTPAVDHWLSNSSHPRVLHIFEHACNLINEHRQVLSIVGPAIGNGPFNLVIEENISFNQYLSPESSITLQAKEVFSGNLKIDLLNSQPWDPRPNWEVLHDKRADIIQRLAEAAIPDHRTDIPAAFISSFSTALAVRDLSTVLAVAPKLAGLGNGLTPAGDDFIMGALHAAWIIHPSDIATSLGQQIAEAAAPLTTSLSAAWLRSAGRGEAGILWHEFFDALIAVGRTDSPIYTTKVQHAINKILSVGETSGLDALAGFANALKCSTEPKTT